MYQFREELDDAVGAPIGGVGSVAVALAADQILPTLPSITAPARQRWLDRAKGLRERLSGQFDALDLTPDLGSAIGSRRWFRGLGTLLTLSAASLALWPGMAPLEAAPPMTVDAATRDEMRSQQIAPLALGGDSGRHMGATGLVRELAAAPERPRIQFLATYRGGESLAALLQRAGLGTGESGQVAAMVGGAIGAITPGTQLDVTLGRRPAAGQPRTLENLAFRARFDLELEIGRAADGAPLAITQKHIRVDDTPLRIRGRVGDSLYRSARAAGAPASAVQAYLQAINDQTSLERALRPDDTFDLIIAQRRAATGERQAGALLYAGVDRGDKPKVQLMRWGRDGKFYEASGVGEQRGGLMKPVNGPIGSRFGQRRHPILGYVRMHAGLDFKAGYGAPIVAVTDGVVLSAGRAGGCGNAVKLGHGGGIQTRYCHMSRMAVAPGQGVRRGQVIGYVGSTGLSTGAHLHYEMYRNGRPVDPASVQYVLRAQLSGAELQQFRSALAQLRTVEPGAALADLEPNASESAAVPAREIDRLAPAPKRR